MNLDASVRTRGLAGPSVVVRASSNFGYSNPPQRAPVSLAGPLCMWWDACSPQDRIAYVREEYQKMYGVAPSQEIIQAAGSTTTVYKDTLFQRYVVNSPPRSAPTPPTPPVEAAQPGSTGPLQSRDTVLTPNVYPTGSAPVPGNTPVTPSDVQFRNAAIAPPPNGATLQADGKVRDADGRQYELRNSVWVEVKGPIGLPATLGGYPTTTVLSVGLAVLVAIAVAVTYMPKRGRAR